jgi:hypothetical protein
MQKKGEQEKKADPLATQDSFDDTTKQMRGFRRPN